MSAPPSIDIDSGPRGQSADDFLESDSPEMSQHEIKLFASVLVVSAYSDHRARLAELLASDGYRVSQAQSATDALDKIKGQKFDLVVTGIQMHDMDGLELLRIVRESVPSLPVIAIGDANPEMNVVYLRCAELLGAFEAHNFPPDQNRFLSGARQAIRQHRLKR
jgi:DNA-binding NtrC family response regulator